MYRLKPFGVLNGREVPLIELFNDKCAVELLPYGAAVRAIRVPDRTGKLTDICLGYDDLESYRTLDACFGGTIGRCANRIGGARFTIDGTASRPTRGKLPSRRNRGLPQETVGIYLRGKRGHLLLHLS